MPKRYLNQRHELQTFINYQKFLICIKLCFYHISHKQVRNLMPINMFKIIDTRFSVYSRNSYLLPPKPKYSFRHLKRGIQDFHKKYVLVPADKAQTIL